MRTLLLTADFPPRPGGMARYHLDLARGLGEGCQVLAPHWHGGAPHDAAPADVLELPFDAREAHRPWNRLRSRRALGAASSSDLVLVGSPRPFGSLARLVGRTGGACRPALATIHHGGDLLQAAARWREHPLKRRRWAELVGLPDLHIVASRYTRRLARRLGFPEERVAVVCPEVDTEHFAPPVSAEQRRRWRHELGWGADPIVSLFVGRLIERKGIGDLLEGLASQPENVRLVLAGPGDLTHWQRRAELAGVAQRVEFLGDVDHSALPRLYGAADLLVGPSRDSEAQCDPENFGIVFLEAAACGLPVLATRTGGVPEAVDADRNGLLVEPSDVGALAAAWRRLAGDVSLRRRLGEAGPRGPAARYATGTSARSLRTALRDRNLVFASARRADD